VRLFAKGSGAQSNPDSIVVDGQKVFVGYQNVTAKDGTDHKASTVVQYDLSGKKLKTFDVPGHQDGMRMDPATHLLWSMSNEDGHPQLVTIDPSTAAHKTYGFAPTAHGGGYDDSAAAGRREHMAAGVASDGTDVTHPPILPRSVQLRVRVSVPGPAPRGPAPARPAPPARWSAARSACRLSPPRSAEPTTAVDLH